MFPAHVVKPPQADSSHIPLPPPIADLEHTQNKFADLTLTRPKRQALLNNIKNPPQQLSTLVPASPRKQSDTGDDARSNLLAEIRKGKQLRKAQAEEKAAASYQNAVKPVSASGFVDVAALLASRRIFIKDDSEDEETSSTFGTEEDDDEWN